MTHEDWVLFWIAMVSGAIIAFGAAYGPWRTRDRDITKLANLDALASSGNLTPEQREVFAERLAQGVEHLMRGDQISRPFRVQQVVYVVGSLITLGCLYLGIDALAGASWWIRAPLLAVAAVSIWLVVGITGVAPQEWALPRLLQADPAPKLRKTPKSPLARVAVDALELTTGDRLLVLGADRFEIIVLREAVGNDGSLVVVEDNPDELPWIGTIALDRGWKNLRSVRDLAACPPSEFDAVACLTNMAKLPMDEVLATANEMRRVLRPGGRAYLSSWRWPRVLDGIDLVSAMATVFGHAESRSNGRYAGVRASTVEDDLGP